MHFAFLLTQIDGATAIRKLLAHALLTSIFPSLQGDRQCNAAVDIMRQLDLTRWRSHIGGPHDVNDLLAPALSEAIYDRPESEKSVQQASATLLATMARVNRQSEPVVWLADETSVNTRLCTLLVQIH